MLDTTHMDLADLEGSLAGLEPEMKYELGLSLIGQYMGNGQVYDEYLIFRTSVADLDAHHNLHHQMVKDAWAKGIRNVLSSLSYRPGVDRKLGWSPAGRRAIRKTLNGTARALGERIR